MSSNNFNFSSLPPAFLEFLKNNNINPTIYSITNLPRYILHFFGLNNNVRIVDCKAYKEKEIIGIDLSSGVAVYALDIQPNDHILDLCCAPGAKLCMISNILAGDNKGFGTITGVDISQNRLSTCRSLIKKHKINHARLFLADGTKFNVYAPCNLKYFKKILNIIEDKKDDDDEKKTKQQSKDDIIKPFYSPKIFRNDQQIKDPRYLYDKVIVDAECTHDGSIVHILKKNLLKNGWELLKPGGILVYSTCSLTRKQNEEIIEWFLLQNKEQNAVLEQIPNIENMKTI
nr:7202_t:CDS:2 [Entrophospora candida]